MNQSTDPNDGLAFSTRSKFDKSFEALHTGAAFARLESKYQVKPFFIKYRPLAVFLAVFSYGIQALTVAVSWVCVVALVAPMLGAVVAHGVAVLVLIGIEAVKRLTFRPLVKDYLQFSKVAGFSAFLSAAMLAVSLWLTYEGGHDTVFALTDAPPLASVDSSTTFERQRIAQLTAQLSDIKRAQSWKGVLTPKGQTSYNRVTAQIDRMEAKVLDKETRITKANARTTDDHTAKTTAKATQFRFVTVLLDLLLFVLLAWLEYYDFRSYTEFAKLSNDEGSTPSVLGASDSKDSADSVDASNALRLDAMRKDATANGITSNFENPNQNRTVIKGFTKDKPDDNALRLDAMRSKPPQYVIKKCEHCSHDFERKTTFQKYCGEPCRIAAWEARTGKRFKPKVKV